MLAERGAMVVSGLAYGIDAWAHQGCLDGGGQTVAVLGTPITQIYPSTNKPLARKMIENGGAILSEYGPDAKIHRDCFRYRNRIVSGLADALIVVEAAAQSGTTSTANFANDQGRSVFAVPGDIDRETTVGTNRLIMDGAGVFVSIDDMLDSIRSSWRGGNAPTLDEKYPPELIKILRALARGRTSIDLLASKLKMGIQDLCVKLSLLEINGEIRSDSAGNWSLAH